MSAKFLVTTQVSYLQKKTKSKHICDARSHTAKHQHAIRHAKDDASILVKDQTRVRQPLPEPLQSIQPEVTAIQDQRPQSSGSQSIFNAGAGDVWDEEDEDLALDDLIDIFPSTLSEEKGITTTFVQEQMNGQARDARNKQKQALLDGSTSQEMTLNIQTLSKGYSQANAPRKRVSDRDTFLPAIAQISSTLDPFIRLPTEISEQEKSLVHFCKSDAHVNMTRLKTSRFQLRPTMDLGYFSRSSTLSRLRHCAFTAPSMSYQCPNQCRPRRVDIQPRDCATSTPLLLRTASSSIQASK